MEGIGEPPKSHKMIPLYCCPSMNRQVFDSYEVDSESPASHPSASSGATTCGIDSFSHLQVKKMMIPVLMPKWNTVDGMTKIKSTKQATKAKENEPSQVTEDLPLLTGRDEPQALKKKSQEVTKFLQLELESFVLTAADEDEIQVELLLCILETTNCVLLHAVCLTDSLQLTSVPDTAQWYGKLLLFD